MLLVPAIANAQAAAPAPAPMPPPTTPAPATTDAAPMPPPAEAAPAAPAPATAPEAIPKTQSEVAIPPPPDTAGPTTPNEAMPSTATEEKLPPINVAAWLRIGARFQGATDPKKINDQQMDNIYGELHAGGKITKNVSVVFNLNANGLSQNAQIEDAIIGFDIVDEFHVWVGQELVPVDRANYGGPFFTVPWNYPGFLTVGGTTTVMAPHEGQNGRNAGVTLWGDVGAGKFKYAVGMFDNGNVASSPLVSGRISAAFIGEETGYFGNASYFGDKNILSLGLGGQYQKNGSTGGTGVDPKNFGEFNADLLGEFKLGDSGGWVTGDAAFYHFAGTNEAIHNAFYVMAAIATPKVGIGNIQPSVRYQWGRGEDQNGVPAIKASAVDVGLDYLIKGPALRLIANYQHVDLGGTVIGNAIQLGAQAIFF
ncbi:MAG TPA: hypothetical protein VH062_08455 [Polyangiaceae bacterium]|nr:hypothetical protein [Polyangiaceae bacterium]